MSVINEEALYFKQVAHVLGREKAIEELEKAAVTSGDEWLGENTHDDELGAIGLAEVMWWCDTPQGEEFWQNIMLEAEAANITEEALGL